ncbi:MAG: hypothetical protein V4596_14120 [Bdellovibrionota bacterium]
MNRIVFLILILLLSSCAHRNMTREEWLEVGQRTYSNTTKEQLIKNAEKILVLADGDDFKFIHKPNGFVASRSWLIYLVISATMGTDHWNFEVQEKDGKLIATVNASQTAGSVTGYAVNNQAGTVTTPTMGTPIQGTAIYDTFWNRLDYLQGLKNDWMDCKRANRKIKDKETWGNIEPLCLSINVKDDLPNDLSDIEVDRIFKQTSLDDDRPARAKKKYLKNRNKEHR